MLLWWRSSGLLSDAIFQMKYPYKNYFEHFFDTNNVDIAILAFCRDANIKTLFQYHWISILYGAYFFHFQYHYYSIAAYNSNITFTISMQ